MATEQRLIDANALIKKADWFSYEDEFGSVDEFQYIGIEAVETAPTVDAVPVVRCKDCKYKFTANGHDKKGCPLDGVGLMNEDDFCSCGERRTDV